MTEADFSKSKGAAGGDGGEENSDDAKKKADKYAHVPKEIRKNAALLKRKAERQLGWDGFGGMSTTQRKPWSFFEISTTKLISKKQ